MYLTKEEEAMYNGEYGEAISKSMKILVTLGEINDAERLIPINSAHIAGLSYKTHGDAGIRYLEDLVKAGATVKTFTTLNVIGVDRERWKELGLPKDWAIKQLRILELYEVMGCIGSCSCTPYYHSVFPRFGEHVAWAESSAIAFINSVIGARTNREGGPSALAAALTGRTPLYGYHLDENRVGTDLVQVNAELEGIHDFGALGYYIGKIVGSRRPVFEGLSKETLTTENLVALGAALASSGAVALYHIVGVTPEAPTLEKAFNGERPSEYIKITKKEIKEAYEQLTSASSEDVDYVAIGCPHCSLRQIREVAELLKGGKIHRNTRLFIHTSVPIKALAEKAGYVRIIENAGGIVTTDMCTVLSCVEALGLKTVATNSAKLAFYAPGSNGLKVWYGSIRECIAAAINGRWGERLLS